VVVAEEMAMPVVAVAAVGSVEHSAGEVAGSAAVSSEAGSEAAGSAAGLVAAGSVAAGSVAVDVEEGWAGVG
jgi:hypothetical protein